jgi:hypothetical protein
MSESLGIPASPDILRPLSPSSQPASVLIKSETQLIKGLSRLIFTTACYLVGEKI